ncbi:NlpC/P60 family protein [Catalinimonas alkaloidigena]|uniref:NlpC/P60 family protein n=1 Tax=Catalinimonas alkaloidigena TaxID=1075417 RepID=A0A1G9NFX7_9BACT|nr:C40 family peptidase [Catalinimonas alkaloidigena]SDL85468.1 NlpC/P60 family protein [Catalinimonas alkaloidigena]
MKKWFWPLMWLGVMVSGGWLFHEAHHDALLTAPASDSLAMERSAADVPLVPIADVPSAQDAPPVPELVVYAQTLLGTPYCYASTNPSKGFDCSGFVYHVFEHYGYDLPRSSRLMAREGREVTPEEARPGDLIFFRGTDPNSSVVGHVGIVVAATGEEPLRFIHASSNRTTPEVKYDSLVRHYKERFVSVKRVQPAS